MIRSSAFLLCILATALAELTSQGILNYLAKTEELSTLTPDVELPCSNDFHLLIIHAVNANNMAELKKSLTGVTEEEAKAKWMKFIAGYCVVDKDTPLLENPFPECTKEQLEEYFPLNNKTEEQLLALKKYSEDSLSMAINLLEYGVATLRQTLSNEPPLKLSDGCMDKIDDWETRQKKELNEHFGTVLSGIDKVTRDIKDGAMNMTEFMFTYGTMEAGLLLICYRSGPIGYGNYDALIYYLIGCLDEETESQN